jgi:predicted 3-demethylubiquinone-9 3-methyltransferase (glyoxalase superfamily)
MQRVENALTTEDGAPSEEAMQFYMRLRPNAAVRGFEDVEDVEYDDDSDVSMESQ